MLGVAITLFVLVFSYLSVKRYLTLNSYYYDLGIMNQVVDNTSRGRFLEMTNQQLGKNASRLAIHFDPILAVFAPVYLIIRSPSVLLVSQVIIVGLGALAVYLLGMKTLRKKPVSLMFAILYLLYYQVQRQVLFDFHSVALATSFFLFAFYFYEAKKVLPYFLFIFLALLTKEHVGLIVIMYGIYIGVYKRDLRNGIMTAALGGIFFVSTVYFIIPYFRSQEHFALKYFEDFGDSPSKIIINIFTNPFITLGKIFARESVDYIFRLFSPVLYSLFSPLTILIALPELAINILSINSNMRSYYFHYSAIIVPVLFYAMILGYKNQQGLIKDKKIRSAIFVIFMIANALSFYRYNPVPALLVKEPARYHEMDPVKKKTIYFLMDKLKDDSIKLSTTPRLAPFFTNRRYYHNFLYDTAFAQMGQTEEGVLERMLGSYEGYDYVIIDTDEIGEVDSGKLPVKFYQHLRQNENYRMVLSDDKFIEVYKKIDGEN